MRAHSLRKYFRTQLASLGVNTDYINYMMGHTVDTYHDIQMKGPEFLRTIYAASGLGIRPKTQVSKMEMLKHVAKAWGLDLEQIHQGSHGLSQHNLRGSTDERASTGPGADNGSARTVKHDIIRSV